MTYLMLMILLLIVEAVSEQTLRLIARDGRGTLCPPVSHLEDPQFRPPGAR